MSHPWNPNLSTQTRTRGGDKGSDSSEVPNPSFAPELVFPTAATIVVFEMLCKAVGNAHPDRDARPHTAAIQPMLVDSSVGPGLKTRAGLLMVGLQCSCITNDERSRQANRAELIVNSVQTRARVIPVSRGGNAQGVGGQCPQHSSAPMG